jgi:molybdopterin-guanine dinucleotide biosynthesis protein A
MAHDRGVASVSGILLAGGQSRRMGGVNKALLEIGGSRIIERTASALCHAFQEVLVITNSPDDFQFLGLPMFRDVVPGRGSLGGLYTGLRACKGDYGFLAACDMPFLSVAVIRHIANSVDGFDVVVPRISGMLEPLHAAYSRACLPYIEALLQHESLKILNLYDKVKVREVPEEDLLALDPELRFIVNVNTPEDLQRAREYAALSGD